MNKRIRTELENIVLDVNANDYSSNEIKEMLDKAEAELTAYFLELVGADDKETWTESDRKSFQEANRAFVTGRNDLRETLRAKIQESNTSASGLGEKN